MISLKGRIPNRAINVKGRIPDKVRITGTVDIIKSDLDKDSWQIISQRSQAGTAQNYYSIGDVKKIHIEGTVGTLAVNQDVYVTILGFDHNSELEGSGITFGCFKDVTDLTNIALVDSNYYQIKTDGTKAFNISHWDVSNYGGWAGSDLRYDILGSTDVAPNGYGTAPDSSRVGYNPTSTCATSPVANTLMSCLPSDLRAKMKPITKYTDNVGGGTNVAENVTSSTDYLPLLSEFEVFGYIISANQYEPSKQLQYAYFANGNAKIKYKHSDKSRRCGWWVRSPAHFGVSSFGVTSAEGSEGTAQTNRSLCLAPIFLI